MFDVKLQNRLVLHLYFFFLRTEKNFVEYPQLMKNSYQGFPLAVK